MPFLKNKRFILPVGIGIIILIAVSFLLLKDKPLSSNTPISNPSITSSQDGEPPLSFGRTTKQQRLDHIKWVYAHGQHYPENSLTKDGPKEYVVTYYQPNLFDSNVPEKEIEGGILLFKIENNIPKLIWEATDDIGGVRPSIWVTDMTGDDQNEIVALWGNGKGEILFIYKQIDSSSFKLVTPKEQRGLRWGSTMYSLIFNANDGEINIEDLDNDDIPEISFPTQYVNGIRQDKESYVAYKWNHSKEEYFLWKVSEKPFVK